MRSIAFRRTLTLLVISLSLTSALTAQKRPEKKYPSLLWEITGHGLRKPSYLFGTMHVSSKMVFHLSDSFYLDLRSADMVALELDPRLWQDQLFRYDNMQTNLRFYTQGSPRDYLNVHSFQLEKYEDRLKAALSDEPTLINGLLYRTFQARADFEEDTYLDLYIYQTGMKLGKQATGVENFFQTEELTMEAAQDMMKDRERHRRSTGGESMYEIERKSEDAYRTGDLDLLDSLEKLLQPSDAYMEKFLYRRNEIQAGSIDSIVRRHSLFVGVGAAHLPGKRGVIELLRKKGYTLRPVLMQDRDAAQKDTIDKIRVPVTFSDFTSDDGAFSVQAPGRLYRRVDTRSADSWQYADMGNGAYYMVGRVKTYAGFLGQKEDVVMKKVDSLLYENVPGKIMKKESVVKDGYKGFDITSKTRRGDIQRYNIFVTPLEVLVFKMSGNGNYVDGKEADQFFGSIRLREKGGTDWTTFSPPQGGFSIRMPGLPSQNKNTTQQDGTPRWEYEAEDPSTGNAFLVWKKTVQNFRFLEEDTADLALAEESFQSSDWLDKTLTRRTSLYKGSPCLDACYLGKDGSVVRARYLLRGPHFFVLASRSRNKDKAFPEFFDSFAFAPYRYPRFRNYVDTFLHISVTTPVVPDIDAGMRNLMERASSEDFSGSGEEYDGKYWSRPKTALFQDDSTGEAVYVSMETFPRYYCPKDSAAFWEEETDEKRLRKDFVVTSKQRIGPDRPGVGYAYLLSDTNTSRLIHSWTFFRDERLYHITWLDDSTHDQASDFVSRFYHSLRAADSVAGAPVFSPKLDAFFKDLNSADSATRHRARQAIPHIYFGAAGFPRLLKAIVSLSPADKDYFTTRSKLISELGYIDDSTVTRDVVKGLRTIYERSGDTSTFQHAALRALAHQKTRPAYEVLKMLLVQDPPIFENSSDYKYLFQTISDSLALARSLFPDLLQLAVVDDYKENVRSLLSTLVDSGFLKAADYESWFTQLYFDAKIQWKKQEGRDEKRWQKKEGEKDEDATYEPDFMAFSRKSNNDLQEYAVLLMPFYDKNATIPRFFDKLLQSRDAALRLSTVVLLLRNNKPVADSILNTLAASDRYRCTLYKELKEAHKEARFPATYNTQLAMARSSLVNRRGGNEIADIKYVDKRLVQVRQQKGYMYLFKYRLVKEDEWKIGFSGLQPLDTKQVNGTGEGFIALTSKTLVSDTPEQEQFDRQLRKFILSRRKNASVFYADRDYYTGTEDDDD